ncbi:MAG TPA: extracellular solute-binding protein, partial [Blastocatellia bacterium]|nr:extracellular solute-binding protein [Blastocatellia bacterium]
RRWLPRPLTSFTGLVYLFLYAPIVVLVGLSFNSSRFTTIWQGFTWRWYQLAWRDAELVAALRMSLIVGLLTTLLATLVGTAAALALARYRVRLRRAAEAVVFLPVIIPEIVIGFATAALFGALGVAFGVSTIIAAHVAFSISYVVFIVRARAAGLSRSLEEAAMDLGATPWQTFVKVTLPLILPAVVAAALLVFTLSLDDYVITSFVAGPGAATLPLKIYSMVKTGVTPEINAISTVLLAVTVMMVFVSDRLASGRKSRWTVAAGACAAALLLFFAFGGQGRSARGGELNVYIWSNYLPDNVVAEFERRYDAKVNIELYDSNEALLAKLQSGGAAYDIVVPSDYMVTVLKAQGLIEEIDRDRVTNFSNLDPRFAGLAYDPANQYSVPYMWGTTGIAYRKDKVTGAVDSWSALWDAQYADRLAMLDDVRETFGAALKMMGKSLNSTEPEDLRAAAELLIQQKPLLKAYDSGGFDQLLLSGDVWVTQAYSGQIAKAMADNDNIGYVIPKEGCTMFVDNLCIPRVAKNRELAAAFINYVLEAKTAAEIANGTGYSSPNLAARAFIRPDLLANEAAYPPREALDRCELIQEVGSAISVYDRYWTEVKSK